MRKVDVVPSLIICSVMAGGFAFYLEVLRPSMLFSGEKKEIERLLSQWWEERPPIGVNKDLWRESWVIVYNAFGNVCVTSDYVSLDELHRLKADLLTKMHRPATIACLRWFWERLAETGPHGKQYIKQMTPLLDEALGKQAVPDPAIMKQ